MSMPPIYTAIPIPYAELVALCRRWHVRRLWLFGSVLRLDFTDDSDVDVMVEFERDHTPGWEVIALQEELTALFGRQAHLSTHEMMTEVRLLPYIQRALLYERPRRAVPV